MQLSKTLIAPLVGVLLVGAAGAVLATSGSGHAAGPGVIPAATTPSPEPSAGTATRPVRDNALDTVLDDLVTKGTITAAQRTAIVDALAAERAARQADRKARQAERKATRDLIRGFLSDGVITKAELDQLPADHPLRQMTSLMADGKITLQELRSLGREFMKDVGGRGMWGGGRWGPNASASPATGG